MITPRQVISPVHQRKTTGWDIQSASKVKDTLIARGGGGNLPLLRGAWNTSKVMALPCHGNRGKAKTGAKCLESVLSVAASRKTSRLVDDPAQQTEDGGRLRISPATRFGKRKRPTTQAMPECHGFKRGCLSQTDFEGMNQRRFSSPSESRQIKPL